MRPWIALAALLAAPAQAEDVQLVSARIVSPAHLEVRLVCQKCPPAVRVELAAGGGWVPAPGDPTFGSSLPLSAVTWKPIAGSSGSAVLVIENRRTLSLTPGILLLDAGRLVSRGGQEIFEFKLGAPGFACAVLEAGEEHPPQWPFGRCP